MSVSQSSTQAGFIPQQNSDVAMEEANLAVNQEMAHERNDFGIASPQTSRLWFESLSI
jgi:hypothetical protein